MQNLVTPHCNTLEAPRVCKPLPRPVWEGKYYVFSIRGSTLEIIKLVGFQSYLCNKMCNSHPHHRSLHSRYQCRHKCRCWCPAVHRSGTPCLHSLEVVRAQCKLIFINEIVMPSQRQPHRTPLGRHVGLGGRQWLGIFYSNNIHFLDNSCILL